MLGLQRPASRRVDPARARRIGAGSSYFFLTWVSAEPAALFAALLDFGSARTFAALLAAFFPVVSFLPAMPRSKVELAKCQRPEDGPFLLSFN